MSVMKGLRRMFGHQRGEDIDAIAAPPTDPALDHHPTEGSMTRESAEAFRPHPGRADGATEIKGLHPHERNRLAQIEASIASGREVQDRTLETLERLPRTLDELERVADGQEALGGLLREIRAGIDRHATQDREFQERLAYAREREEEVFEAIRRHLDASHDTISLTASKLADISDLVRETTQSNQRTATALTAMVEELQAQEKRQEARSSVVQGWIVTCVVACIGATAAALALAWTVMESRG